MEVKKFEDSERQRERQKVHVGRLTREFQNHTYKKKTRIFKGSQLVTIAAGLQTENTKHEKYIMPGKEEKKRKQTSNVSKLQRGNAGFK